MLSTLWVLWALVLACSIVFVVSAARASPRHAGLLLAIVLLALFLRGGITHDNFYGLEYEDAYVYAASSRQAALADAGTGFRGLMVCAVGSLQDCSITEVFPGHLPGFPALLRAAQSVVGYRVSLGPEVGALISSAAVVSVWWAAWTIYRSFSAAAVTALLFAATPVLALYGGSATSESASSLPIAVALAAAATTRRSTGTSKWLRWHGVALGAAVLAVTIRRENMILIGVLPACLLIRPAVSGTRVRLLAMLLWFGVALFAARLVFPSVVMEVGEFGQLSFGFSRVLETVPTILHALLTPQWFGITAMLAGLGILGAVTSQRDRPEQDVGLLFAVAVGALGMVLLYGAHVRSTYQLMGVAAEPFDFLRYLANVGVFLCILAPAAARLGPNRAETSSGGRRVGFVIAAAYVAFSVWTSWTLRQELVSTERHERTEPAIAAIGVAAETENRYPIVTFEPLVVQLYGSPRTKVIALEFLTPARVRAAGGRVLYIRQDHYENDIDRRRYAESLSALPADEVSELKKGSGWSVLAMSTVHEAQKAGNSPAH